MTLKMCKDLQGPKVEQRLLEFPTFIFDLKLEASNTNAEHRLMVNQSYTGFFVHNKKIMCVVCTLEIWVAMTMAESMFICTLSVCNSLDEVRKISV